MTGGHLWLMRPQGCTFWIIPALAAAVFLPGQGSVPFGFVVFFFFLAVQCGMLDLSFLSRD